MTTEHAITSHEADPSWIQSLLQPLAHRAIEWLTRLTTEPQPSLIPRHLQEQHLALPLTEAQQVSSWSVKVRMFNLISESNAEMNKLHQASVAIPNVTLLSHQLWREWLDNGKEFSTQTQAALEQLFARAIESSPTKKIVIRHLEDTRDHRKTSARSYPGIPSPAAALNALTKQYQHYVKLGWHEMGDQIEVSTGLYSHADPLNYQVKMVDGVQTLKSGQPPIGLVATTSDNGHKISVQVVYGDNLAAQEVPGITDTYHFSLKQLLPGSESAIKLDRSIVTSHTDIHLDRKGKIVTVALPPQFHGAPINLSDEKITRAALFAAIAAGKLGKDVKVEGSLNSQKQLEINSLAEYRPPEQLPITAFATEYQAVAVINSLADARALVRKYRSNSKSPDLDRAPLIVLGDHIKNSTAVGAVVDTLVVFINRQIRNNPISLWKETLIVSTGTAQSHHLDALINLSDHIHHFNAQRLPPIKKGDQIIPEEGRHGDTVWLRNATISGDGELVVTPIYWPKSFPADKIGNKAFHHYEELARPGHPTQPFTVITKAGFLRILQHNGVLETYQSLFTNGNHKHGDKIFNAFQTISSRLLSLPPEITHQLAIILPRLVNNCNECRLIGRSNSTAEDETITGLASRLAGSFESYPNLLLSHLRRRAKSSPTESPRTVEEGILAVIASMFTQDLAEHLSRLDYRARKEVLQRWAMPVEIDKQGLVDVSGVASAFDADNNKNKNVITVSAQVGLGGVVDGVKPGRPVAVIKADRQTKRITSITIQLFEGQSVHLKSLDLRQLTQYGFPASFDKNWIIAVMNTIDRIHKDSGLKNCEWAFGPDDTKNNRPHVYFNQTR